jgi:RimJ/RimL family protein N-acetyltransferase
MRTTTLSAPGVVLRPLETSDAEALFVAHSDPDVHYYWASAAHANVAETRDYLARTLEMAGSHCWAITESGGEALGRISVFVQREGVGEVGVILRRAAAGRGLASKALTLVLAFGLDTLRLHRIYADIDPDNSASLSLFQRAGFQREGLLRGNWKTHIGIRDSVIMGRLRD